MARRQIEEKASELTQLSARLERANAELARSNRDLDQFAYVASHDLRAPLRAIVNLSAWIQEDLGGELPGEVAENLGLLRARARRMESLIEALLQYSRAGRTGGKVESIGVADLVREVAEFVAVPPRIQLTVEGDPQTLVGEKLPLQQVLQNLLGNAARYAECCVSVRWRPRGARLEFRVEDDGPGIAPEYHEKIFTIFQTLASRDEGGGTGIGLSIVKKIVEDLGCSAWVESRAGCGASFAFTWPLGPPPASPPDRS